MYNLAKTITLGGLALFGQGQAVLGSQDNGLQKKPFQNGLQQNLPVTYGNQFSVTPEYQLPVTPEYQLPVTPGYQLINSTQNQIQVTPEYQLQDNFVINNWKNVIKESNLNNKKHDNKIVETIGEAYNNGNLWIYQNGQVFFDGNLYDNLNEVYNLGPNLPKLLPFPRIKPMSTAMIVTEQKFNDAFKNLDLSNLRVEPLKILGLKMNATNEQIKKAYRKLSLRFHPNKKNGNEHKFIQITNAKNTLLNPQFSNGSIKKIKNLTENVVNNLTKEKKLQIKNNKVYLLGKPTGLNPNNFIKKIIQNSLALNKPLLIEPEQTNKMITLKKNSKRNKIKISTATWNTVIELMGQGRLGFTQDNKIIINGDVTNTPFSKFLKNIEKNPKAIKPFYKDVVRTNQRVNNRSLNGNPSLPGRPSINTSQPLTALPSTSQPLTALPSTSHLPILPPPISIPSSSQNTKNIKTIYRNARIIINNLLEKLIKALKEKHEASNTNRKFGSFERKAKKLKTKLMKSRNNLKEKYNFIGDMTDLFDKIINFLHKMKPHIEKSIKKKRKGDERQKEASKQLGLVYRELVIYLETLNLINKNSKKAVIKNLNETSKQKLMGGNIKRLTFINNSRTVHIKGVGKRVVRQTKTGRTYVIVNKKKRYLN